MFRSYTELELATVEDSREPAGLLYQELLNRWAHTVQLKGGLANFKSFNKCFLFAAHFTSDLVKSLFENFFAEIYKLKQV